MKQVIPPAPGSVKRKAEPAKDKKGKKAKK